MKRAREKRKGKNIFKLSAAIVSMLLAVVMIISLIPNEVALAANYLSDINTATKYTESLGDNASTEYAGRIWTDKSVFTEDATFTGYLGESQTVKKGEDDFLIAFSALATSQSISGQTNAPVDVVFIIDISGSMSNSESNMDNGKSRIYNTIQATNEAIDELMALNPYSRIAVVAFSSNAQVLLPLDRYTKSVTTERQRVDGVWQTVEVEEPYFSLNRETGSNNYATLSTNAVNSSNQTIEKTTSVEGGTNIQLGLYEGMQVLAEETSTKADINGSQIQRVPSVVLLSDGSPTYSSDSRNWWAPTDNYNDGPGSAPYAGNGMKAILVGSYMKDAIDRNYGVTGTTMATTVYTIGMGITGLDDDEQNLAYMTLDPGTYWNDTSVTNSMKTTIKEYWTSYTANNNTGTLNINVGQYRNGRYSNKNYALTHPTTGEDVNPETGYDYVNDYYDADNAHAVSEVFKQIVSNISISTPQIPTEHDPANPALTGYITYTDPIGAYMEVKAMKSIIYAGAQYEYNGGAPEKTTEDGVTVEKYIYTQTAQGNEVYGEASLKDIIIEVTTTTDDNGIKTQVLTIQIPATLIPLRVNTVTLNANGGVESHVNNGTYPIRVLYTVGLQEEVKSGENIDLSKLSADYIAKNSNDDGTIDFYSNLYTGKNIVNGKTAGDATVAFDAAATNPFYYMQKDTILYTNEECTEKATALEADKTYYYKETYYHGTQVVTKTMVRTGKQLTGNTTVVQHADGYWYRPAGTVRVNNMLTFEGGKTNNSTGTAESFYAPTYNGETGHFTVYLGNNGLMSVEATGSLEITKNVLTDEGLTAPDKDFVFTVDFGTDTGTYTYVITDASGNTITTASIADGGTIRIKAGQKATVLNLPPDITYIVTEEEYAGFETRVNGQEGNVAEGTIIAGDVATAAFTNHYSVTPITFPMDGTLSGKKVLAGRNWDAGESFTFFLSSTNNAPLPEGYDANVGVTVTDKDAVENEALFAFGTIEYTKPGLYRYTIVEKEPENDEYLPGMTYSRALYSLMVYVQDNGDGTLSYVANVQKLYTDDANPLFTYDSNNQIVMNPGEEGQDAVVFTNTYNAESVVRVPVALKNYTDNSGQNPLRADMFQFKLTPLGRVENDALVAGTAGENPMPIGTDGEKLTEVITTNEGENITFLPVTFTQEDILDGNTTTYRYQMEEVLPEGATAENGYTVNGMTYDGNKYVIDVIVSIDADSSIVNVNAVYPSGERIVTFKNTYAPEEVTLGEDGLAPIQGMKTLTGRDMLEGELFEFTLMAGDAATEQAITDGTIVVSKDKATVSGGEDGVATGFDFGTTTFKKPGTYTFDIVETKGSAGGVTYDTHVCEVNVVVTDNNGKLEAAVTYNNGTNADAAQAVFQNTYEAVFDASTAITLRGTKELTGRDIKEGEFYFAVKSPDGSIAYVPAAVDGAITFIENATYDAAGEYTYEISEVIPKDNEGNVIDNGVTYDTTVYTITVKVTDDYAGNLTAAVVENDIDIIFENTYEAADVVYDFLPLQKILAGDRKDALKDGEFTFLRTVEPKDGIVLLTVDGAEVTGDDTAANTADGNVTFGDIKFTEVGTYVVTITEVVPENKVAGVTYDTHELKATFVVTDDLNGNLVVRITEVHGGQIFTNEYKTTGKLIGAENLEVTKVLDVSERTPNTWQDSDIFTFVLEASDAATAQAIRDGKVVLPGETTITIGKPANGGNTNTNQFEDIVFHAVGEYAFMIREVEGTELGMGYDVSARQIKVITTDNGDGTLTVTLGSGSQINPIFKNVYNVNDVILPGHGNLHVNKVFTGRADNAWFDTDSFQFTLAINEAHEATVAAVADGKLTFAEGATTLTVTKDNKDVAHFGNITFGKAGTYEFMIQEVAGAISGVTYDTNQWKVIVTVEESAETDAGGNPYLVVRTVDYKKLDASGVEINKAEGEANLTFTNTYSTTPVSMEGNTAFEVTKEISGRNWLEGDVFTFAIEAGNSITNEALEEDAIVFKDDNTLTSMTVEIGYADADKKAIFDKITFYKPGNYTFAVSEVVSGEAIDGISYDDTIDHIIVEVIDNGLGVLEVNAASAIGDMKWTNTYTPDAVNATLSGMKLIDGRDMTENDIYHFHIVALNEAAKSALPEKTEVANAVPVNNEAVISFGPISYKAAGIYEYAISERTVNVHGITNDTGYVKATVEVTYSPETGTLSVANIKYEKVNSEGEGFVFINNYSAEGFLDGSTHLKVTKRFTGRANNAWIEDDVFTFTLAAGNADTASAVEAGIVVLPENAAGITIGYVDVLKEKAFGSIRFTQTGEYQFVITEVVPDGDKNGISYDTDAERIIDVIVTDNGDGTLAATVKAGSDSLTYNNSYDTVETVLAGDTYLVVEKQIVGREWISEDAYSFTLEADMTHPLTKAALEAQEPTILMPETIRVTITKDTEGYKAAFGNITFKEAGTYKFLVKEEIPEDKISGITYDNRTKYITVEVADNNDGTMTATATVDNHGNLIFVNTYAAAATDGVTLSGNKQMTGRDLKETDDFEFTITAKDNAPLPAETTVTNADDGTITFAPITFEKAGTYVYEIMETGGSVPGVTNAENTVVATVKVTDNQFGKLEATVTYSEGGFVFTNTYEAAAVDVEVLGNKKVTALEGNTYTMKGEEFQFEILPASTNPSSDPVEQTTVWNTEAGNITFIHANYTESGTYIYTVHEKDCTVAGITKDPAVYEITVVVTDTTNGNLAAEVTFTKDQKAAEAIVFDNTYAPNTITAILSGNKVLESEHKAELVEGLFTFKLEAKDNAPMPENKEAANAGTGYFQFEEITYTKPGEYVYEITEVDGKEAGYSYDGTVYTAKVVVTDKDGYLAAEVTYYEGQEETEVVFTNGYVPEEVTLEGETALKGNKVLSGRDLNAGEFEFTITAEEGTPMPEKKAVTNAKDGGFSFEPITFTKAGTYYYTISETDNGLGGVAYDKTVYTAKVVVTDKGGYLAAEVTYYAEQEEQEAVVFENTYEVAETGIILYATKELTGRDLNAKEFAFELKGEGISQKKYNDADGVVAFDEIKYEATGVYVYTITEVKGNKGGITYDASEYTVTVTVTDNLEGQLEAEVTTAEEVVFENAYDAADTSIILSGKKNLTGRDLADGEFTFLLKNEAGEVIAKATNKADGTITFEELVFTQTGNFKYTIVEDASAKAANITYDDTVYEVVIEVTDNLEGELVAEITSQGEIIFNNLYEVIEVPKTGDVSPIAIWIALAFISTAGCTGALLRRTRR